ncbi:MAG: aquaporin [Methanoregula sp.]
MPSLNTARTFGPYLINSVLGGPNLWIYFPIYIIDPIVGAVLAALFYDRIAAEQSRICRYTTRKPECYQRTQKDTLFYPLQFPTGGKSIDPDSWRVVLVRRCNRHFQIE